MSKKVIALELLQNQVTEIHLEALLETLDRLHEAASEGDLKSATDLQPEQIAGWLEDLIFTAQETIRELRCEEPEPETVEQPEPASSPLLKLVR